LENNTVEAPIGFCSQVALVLIRDGLKALGCHGAGHFKQVTCFVFMPFVQVDGFNFDAHRICLKSGAMLKQVA
jgi:hypothetical protein